MRMMRSTRSTRSRKGGSGSTFLISSSKNWLSALIVTRKKSKRHQPSPTSTARAR